jgi:hypothetical protein
VPEDPTVHLWGRLAPHSDPAAAVSALLGLSRFTAQALVSALVADGPETARLLGSMPAIIRSLTIATTARPERCRGEIRGPILWGETMAARSASAGDEGLFVCAMPERAYDTPENRVLAAALRAIRTAGRHAGGDHVEAVDDAIRRARANGLAAARWLEHRAFSPVPAVKPTGRDLRRARSGHRRRVYRPAIDVLGRAARPVGPEQVIGWADERTLDQHDLVASVLERLAVRGHELPPASVVRGAYRCGPVVYRARFGGPERGVRVGPLLLDVLVDESDEVAAEAAARLARRAGGQPSHLVRVPGDVEAALDRAGFA